MKIFYRKSDNKFCGAENIDKQILGDDKVLSIEIEEEKWFDFIQTAQEIYIENKKLVSKEREISIEEKNLIEINKLKQQLQVTDHKAIKFAEGLIDVVDYAIIKKERQEWRDKIKELQEALNV